MIFFAIYDLFFVLNRQFSVIIVIKSDCNH